MRTESIDPVTRSVSGGAPIGRRAALRSAALGIGGLLVWSACGSEDGGDSSSDDAPSGLDGGRLVSSFEDGSVVAGSDRRFVFALADADGALRDDGPELVGAELVDADGVSLARVEGRRRGVDELPRRYYEFRLDVPETGLYELRPDGAAVATPFTVSAPGALRYPGPGDPIPPTETPTTDDGRGVDPICTREPACQFHDRTLAAVAANGTPTLYLVGTPAFCQTGVCGPTLDIVIDVSADYPGLDVVHAEIYTDTTATAVAPAVTELGLSFEPAIFLLDGDGLVVERLDVIVSDAELRERLDLLV